MLETKVVTDSLHAKLPREILDRALGKQFLWVALIPCVIAIALRRTLIHPFCLSCLSKATGLSIETDWVYAKTTRKVNTLRTMNLLLFDAWYLSIFS